MDNSPCVDTSGLINRSSTTAVDTKNQRFYPAFKDKNGVLSVTLLSTACTRRSERISELNRELAKLFR